jgi:hypothetical protein
VPDLPDRVGCKSSSGRQSWYLPAVPTATEFRLYSGMLIRRSQNHPLEEMIAAAAAVAVRNLAASIPIGWRDEAALEGKLLLPMRYVNSQLSRLVLFP